MKWYNSILTKITLLFLLALLGISIITVSLIKHLKNRELQDVEHIARLTFRYNYDKKNGFDLEALKKEGFIYQKNSQIKRFLKRHHHNYKHHNQHHKTFKLRVISKRGEIFVLAKIKDKSYMVFKYTKSNSKVTYLIYFLGGLLAIVLLYIGIIKSILPLNKLRYKIKEFAGGNYDIECKSDKKDEIALLSNEFHYAVRKIKRLKNSRDLFLRNIMHELKTPITKGKLALEMIEESSYKRILSEIFDKQESLIEEFARIEKLSADELKLNIKTYRLEDIVDYAVDLLEEQKSIQKELKDLKIDADFELFAIALKNLLDNGLSYSFDNSVKITNDSDSITISNRGDRLKYDINEYLKPHHIEEGNGGLGFGLYITSNILRLHGFKLNYEHKNSINYFKIML